MPAAELMAGISAFKTMLDMAKAMKDMNDTAIRNGAVIELQEKILTAREAQSALLERVGALEAEVRSFETWDAEKQRYELKDIGQPGFTEVLVYRLKEAESASEPAHSICPDCYQRRLKSILQHVTRDPGNDHVQICQQCGWEGYTEGGWRPEHGITKSASRKAR